MNIKIYEKIQEGLEDVFSPPSEEEMKDLSRRRFMEEIKRQGAYENPDGTWSCNYGMYFSHIDIEEFPIKFKEVKGDFTIRHGKLSSLVGCPEKIRGNFECQHTQVTSLNGCPKEVGGHFWCYNNPLKSLENGPIQVGKGISIIPTDK